MSKQWKFKAICTDRSGYGGFYGYGDTAEEALTQCQSACGSKSEWKRNLRRVVVDLETGQEVHREGKR